MRCGGLAYLLMKTAMLLTCFLAVRITRHEDAGLFLTFLWDDVLDKVSHNCTGHH
jgi:hypothetical protein